MNVASYLYGEVEWSRAHERQQNQHATDGKEHRKKSEKFVTSHFSRLIFAARFFFFCCAACILRTHKFCVLESQMAGMERKPENGTKSHNRSEHNCMRFLPFIL